MADRPIDPKYATVRGEGVLGHALQQRIVDITQADPEELKAGGVPMVYLHLENGMVLCFPVPTGFGIQNHPEPVPED